MAEQCRAKATTTGERCRKPPTPGTTVCSSHGSRAPQVRAAAARRLQEQAAATQLVALGHPVEIDPARALLGLVHAKAGEVAWLREKVRDVAEESDVELVWGLTKLKTGGDDAGSTVEAKPSVWWTLLRTAEDQLADYSTRALKAGIEERRVQLAEDQGRLVAGVLTRILAGMFQVVVAAVRAAGLTDEQARTALQVAWQHAVSEIVPRELRALEGTTT